MKHTIRSRRLARRSRSRPVLRFSPTAWAKLLFMRDFGATEVGGFGLAPGNDLLFVQDVRFIKQTCTSVSVAFDDTAVAEFFEDQVDRGLKPEQFARLWIHTHPGNSAEPSFVDEGTFSRVFGRADWALDVHPGPRRRDLLAPAIQRRSRRFAQDRRRCRLLPSIYGMRRGAWAQEYRDSVHALPPQFLSEPSPFSGHERVHRSERMPTAEQWPDAWHDYLADASMFDDFDFLPKESLDRDC